MAGTWSLILALTLATACPAESEGAEVPPASPSSPTGTGTGTRTGEEPSEHEDPAAEPQDGGQQDGRSRTRPPRRRRGLPLIHNPGAWDWVAEIFVRVIQAADMEPLVPTPKLRARLAGWNRPVSPDRSSEEGSEGRGVPRAEQELPGGERKPPRHPSEEDEEADRERPRARSRRGPRGPARRPGSGLPPEAQKVPENHALLLLARDPSVNAFVSSNRWLVVTHGLLSFVRSDDELAGVMAHEVGHFQGQHLRTISRKQQLLAALGMIGGALVGKGSSAMAGMALGRMAGLGYNRAAEFDADRRGFAIVRDAGYHPNGMLTFMERLRQHHAELGLDYDDPLSTFFSTHPPSVDRARRLERMVRSVDGLDAPSGLSYHFRREIFGPGRAVVSQAMARTVTTTEGAFTQLAPEDLEGIGETLVRARLGGFRPLPEGFETLEGTAVPLSRGVLLSGGCRVEGPVISLDPDSSYLLSGRMRAWKGSIRAFLGLELLDEEGRTLGVMYPGDSGTFLTAKPTRLTAVSHPFSRRELARGRFPVAARIVLATSQESEGRVLLEELGFAEVGDAEPSFSSGIPSWTTRITLPEEGGTVGR